MLPGLKMRPSLIFASTITFWFSASRMRVENAAFPAIGENWKLATRGHGLASATTRISLTWSSGAHRAFDRDRQRHAVAVLDRGREIERDPAGFGVRPPVKAAIVAARHRPRPAPACRRPASAADPAAIRKRVTAGESSHGPI